MTDEPTMRAAMYHGAGELRVEQVPRPVPSAGEVLLRVTSCGVCGTDMRIVAGQHRRFPPGTRRIPGHEIVGRVVEAGSEVAGSVPEGMVALAPNFGCGRCIHCLSGHSSRCAEHGAVGITVDGGFAEFVRVPAPAVRQGCLIAVGEHPPAEIVLTEPLGTVVRGQAPLGIGPQDTVLIVGGGPIGNLHAALARLKGAARVIVVDRWDARLEIARSVGADVTVNARNEHVAERLDAETGGTGADVVIVAAPSHEAQAEALRQAAAGGRISFFAGLPKSQPTVELETNLIHYKELQVSGTTACSALDCSRAAQTILAGRMKLTPLLTGQVPLDGAADAFAATDRSQLKTQIVP